jgi:hypothetical protein
MWIEVTVEPQSASHWSEKTGCWCLDSAEKQHWCWVLGLGSWVLDIGIFTPHTQTKPHTYKQTNTQTINQIINCLYVFFHELHRR